MSSSFKVSLTGAFSYTGRYISYELIDKQIPFQAITNHPRSSLFPSNNIPVYPLQFNDSKAMVGALQKTNVLINTYWVRYPASGISHESAVRNIDFLVECAKNAGIEKIIHVSVSNPSKDSTLSYFKGKAEAEEIVKKSGIQYTILRPTLVFGKEDILIHNIAWLLKHFPFFLFPSPSKCSIQPISAKEVGQITFQCLNNYQNQILDLAGPETVTMSEMIHLIGKACGYDRPVFSAPSFVTMAAVKILNTVLQDRIITKEEIVGLMENRLVSSHKPLGTISFSQWLTQEGSSLSSNYINDFKRFFGKDKVN